MSKSDGPTPVIVVGMNRGGTTMLSNVLCRHPLVGAPQHRLHWGCKECQLLQHSRYWGDLTDLDRFIYFLELYSSGDFFRLAGGNKEYFYRNRPSDFYEFFFELMDGFAAQNGLSFWVAKLEEPFYHFPDDLKRFLAALSYRYAQPRFIGVVRDFPGVLKSHIRRRLSAEDVQRTGLSLKNQWFALTATLRYGAQHPKIRRIVRERDGLLLDFAEVVGDMEAASRRICGYLGVEYAPEMLERRFVQETSFANSQERANVIPQWQLSVLDRFFCPLFEAAHPVCSAWRRFRDSRKPQSCPLHWRLLTEEYSLASPEQAVSDPRSLQFDPVCIGLSAPKSTEPKPIVQCATPSPDIGVHSIPRKREVD